MPRAKKQHLKRRKDGRYACRYKDQWFMAYSEEEALAARERYKQAEKEGLLASVRPVTVEQYAAKWLRLYKSNVSKKCFNDYANYMDKLIPVIGKKALSDVTVDDAARVWTYHDWRSGDAVRHAKMLYVGMFDTAIENDLCRKNPFRSKSAKPPKLQTGSHRALTDEEIKLIETTPHRFQLAAMIMLYAGLRRGEVSALTMADVDQEAGVIHITKAVRYDSNQPILSDPKTEAGVRDVPIFPPLAPFLKDRIGLVAPSARGKMLSNKAFYLSWESYKKSLALMAGHEVDIRPHDLRHTFCTMLRDAGVDMKQAMLWMGHADENMILRIYDHVGENRTKNSIAQVEKLLIGRQNGRQDVSHETNNGLK